MKRLWSIVFPVSAETTKSRSRPVPWTDTCRVRNELVLNGSSRASIRAGTAGPRWPQETHVPERKTSKRASEEGRTKPAGRGVQREFLVRRSAGSDRHQEHPAKELGAGSWGSVAMWDPLDIAHAPPAVIHSPLCRLHALASESSLLLQLSLVSASQLGCARGGTGRGLECQRAEKLGYLSAASCLHLSAQSFPPSVPSGSGE